MSLGLTRDSILDLSNLIRESGVEEEDGFIDDDDIIDDDDPARNDDKGGVMITTQPLKNVDSLDSADNYLFYTDGQYQTHPQAYPYNSGQSIPTDTIMNNHDSRSLGQSLGNNFSAVNKRQGQIPSVANDVQQPNRTGAYSGFTYDYSEYEGYYSNDAIYGDAHEFGAAHGVKTWGGKDDKKKRNVFCCLFAPWGGGARIQDGNNREEGDGGYDAISRQLPDMTKMEAHTNVEEDEDEHISENDSKSNSVSSSVEEDDDDEEEEDEGDDDDDDEDDDDDADEESADTDVYGEKLTDKDRLAVLARLRLSDPVGAATHSNVNGSNEQDSGAGQSTGGMDKNVDSSVPPPPPPPDSMKPPKGILKRSLSINRSAGQITSGHSMEMNKNASDNNGPKRRSLFPSYSQSSSITSTHSSSSGGGGVLKPPKKIHFAPMARVVTVTARADMSFVERSSIWWQKNDYEDFKKTGRIIAKAMLEGGSEIWLTSNNRWGKRQQQRNKSGSNISDSPEYHQALKSYSSPQNPGEKPSQTDEGDTSYGDKWWCKFGHSRRGLEHIASIEEGRIRQQNVNTAIKAVLDEQRRQLMHGVYPRDNKKLGLVANPYTNWARDLALAAGAADAEAVRENFGSGARGRAHYLLKRSTDAEEKRVVSLPGEGTGSLRYSPQVLDANTSSSIKFLKENPKNQKEIQQQQLNQRPPDPAEEAIHDPSSTPRIAKKAAGFNAHDDLVDMSAVLTGMGPVSPSPDTPASVGSSSTSSGSVGRIRRDQRISVGV